MSRNGFSFSIITLGCAKNDVDSARMKQLLLSAGYCFAEDPADADVVLVNTCAFLQSATEESIGVIFDSLDLPKVAKGGARVAVCGCMPARYGADLAESLTEITCFIPCAEEEQVVEYIDGLFNLGGETEGGCCSAPLYDAGTLSAYIKISDGCDRFCSYCAIPFIRGRYHSFTFEEILADAEDALAAGAKELVLIAQDTGRWGSDFPEPLTLAWLVENLAVRYPETWIRVLYLQPEGITDELLRVMNAYSNVCSYLDIPLQHVQPGILKAMHRKGSAQEYLALLEKIRGAVPGVTLRTTLIAGFPGETDDDVDALLDFLAEAVFDYVGVFPFSPEEGTRAAELPGQLDADTCFDRAQQIRDFADTLSADLIAKRVGRVVPVLIEGREEDGQLVGRTQAQAPEVDGETFVDKGEPGDIVLTRIEDTMMYEMEAVVL